MECEAIFEWFANLECKPEAISRSLRRVRGLHRGNQHGNGTFHGWAANSDRARTAGHAHWEFPGGNESAATGHHGGAAGTLRLNEKICRHIAAAADSRVFGPGFHGWNATLRSGAGSFPLGPRGTRPPRVRHACE